MPTEEQYRAEHEKVFQELSARIASLKLRLNNLNQLHAKVLDQKGMFDDQDEKVVAAVMQDVQGQLQAAERDYEQRLHTYNNVLLVIRDMLQGRQQTLESLDQQLQILKDNEGLRKFFVQKQSDLKKMYQEMCVQLSSSQ